jgi:dolichol kinase
MIPLLATFLGGVSSNMLFPSIAFCGYLIAGIGDAVGELFGAPLGKHLYMPLSKLGFLNKKSYEGSFAVFVFSFIVLAIILPQIQNTTHHFLTLSFIIAFIVTLIEAYSPPACDNFFMQLVPNFLIFYFVV